MKIVDKRMKFSLRFCGMTYGKFVQWNVRAKIERQCRRMKNSWIERATSCGQGKKIVYFKYDAKDEQNHFIRG